MSKGKILSIIVASVLLAWPTVNSTAAAQSLPTWTGYYTYGKQYSYTMVGTNPNSNSTTNIQTFLVPVKFVFSDCSTSQCTFDAQNVVQTVTSSPVLSANVDFVQGGVDLGKTQYVDAFQRGNFWSMVSPNNLNWHLKLQPVKVMGDFTIMVPSGEGCTTTEDFGYASGEVTLGWLQLQFENYIANANIPPNSLPIFLMYDAGEIGQATCNGSGTFQQGQHVAYSPAYVIFSYLDPKISGTQVYRPDVSTLSHEVAEWADDPFGTSQSGCGGHMEVGDTLLGHDYTYNVNNFNYHLQDLAFLPFFGAPATTSVNNWFSFQGEFDDGSNEQNVPCVGNWVP